MRSHPTLKSLLLAGPAALILSACAPAAEATAASSSDFEASGTLA